MGEVMQTNQNISCKSMKIEYLTYALYLYANPLPPQRTPGISFYVVHTSLQKEICLFLDLNDNHGISSRKVTQNVECPPEFKKVC